MLVFPFRYFVFIPNPFLAFETGLGELLLGF